MKAKNFIILFHPIGKEKSVRIDFESGSVETDFYAELKLEGYEMYQFIQEEFKFNMEESALIENQIEFVSLEREVKTWFGFSKKRVTDLLILPQREFFYPYQYGHYFYLFTKKKVNTIAFESWINSNFPEKFSGFDDAYAGSTKDKIKLIDEEDYLIITSHDYQKEFGAVGRPSIIAELIEKLRKLNLNSFEEMKLDS